MSAGLVDKLWRLDGTLWKMDLRIAKTLRSRLSNDPELEKLLDEKWGFISGGANAVKTVHFK